MAKAAALTVALTVLVPMTITLFGFFYNWTKFGQLLVIIGEEILFFAMPAILGIEALVFIAIFAIRFTDRKTSISMEEPRPFDPWE